MATGDDNDALNRRHVVYQTAQEGRVYVDSAELDRLRAENERLRAYMLDALDALEQHGEMGTAMQILEVAREQDDSTKVRRT